MLSTLANYGFSGDNYKKIIVTWDWTDGAEQVAIKNGITSTRLKDILQKIQDTFGKSKSYYSDDTVRLLQLLKKSLDLSVKNKSSTGVK